MIRPCDMMTVAMARLIHDGDTVFHGVSSHMPMIATLLAKRLHAPNAVHLNIPGGVDPVKPALREFTSAGGELWETACAGFPLMEVFDLSMRGGLDVAFLSGVQFDDRGNVNASVIGPYEKPKVRLPGGAGSAVLIPTAKRAIIWRTKHDRRTFTPRVDFITAQGNVSEIVTPLCVFTMYQGQLILKSVHPYTTIDEVAENTAFPIRYFSIETTPPPTAEELRALEEIDPLEDIKARIYAAVDPDAPSTLKDGGVIAKGYHTEVDELRSIRDNTKGVLAQLEARLRQETGIPKLKIGYNHVFGYFIEVSNSYKSMVPETYIRKQTLTSGERYITQELKELESKILGAHERLITLEHRLFSELLESISAQLDRIQRTANAVAQLDVLTALAQVAAENNYCRPIVDDSDELTITEGRHPVVEQMLKGSLFVPNDTTLNCGADRCLIITGPNMAGKSTYMRQNALIALMAQIGSFVPASSCHVGVVDAIFTRIGASDDLSAGQSTFMVEMTEVAEILKNATAKSLVVLDEIGRGTSTFDGMSIARAVVEHIADPAKGLGCKTLFATHYHELTELEGGVDGVKNYNIAVKKRGEDITFLRRIVRGPADDSYGIEVAKLAGLPGSVTRRAHEVLRALEATAPKNKVEQMDFDALQEYNSPAVPSEMMDKLEALDVETLTPIEALNFLYELKKTLKGSLNR